MINKIVNTFKDVCRKHKLIKSFYYHPNYKIGTGNELHPVFWLESPIYIRNYGQSGAGIEFNINFTIQVIPNEKADEIKCETLAFSTGLNIIEYIKKYRAKENLFKIQDNWTALTLRHYYDNDAVAVRFSLTIQLVNPTNICLLDEQFDEDKEFEIKELINDFDVTPANNCTTFVDKLSDFNIPTTR